MRSAAFFQQITNPREIPVNYTVRKPQHRQLILLRNLRPHAVILLPFRRLAAVSLPQREGLSPSPSPISHPKCAEKETG